MPIFLCLNFEVELDGSAMAHHALHDYVECGVMVGEEQCFSGGAESVVTSVHLR